MLMIKKLLKKKKIKDALKYNAHVIGTIDELFCKYCFETKKQKGQFDDIAWVGELGGGRRMIAIMDNEFGIFTIALENSTAYTTQNPIKNFDRLLNGFIKNELLVWVDNHQGIAKTGDWRKKCSDGK